ELDPLVASHACVTKRCTFAALDYSLSSVFGLHDPSGHMRHLHGVAENRQGTDITQDCLHGFVSATLESACEEPTRAPRTQRIYAARRMSIGSVPRMLVGDASSSLKRPINVWRLSAMRPSSPVDAAISSTCADISSALADTCSIAALFSSATAAMPET